MRPNQQTIAQRRALARKLDRDAEDLAARLKKAPVGTKRKRLAELITIRTQALRLGRAAR